MPTLLHLLTLLAFLYILGQCNALWGKPELFSSLIIKKNRMGGNHVKQIEGMRRNRARFSALVALGNDC